jgi:uncharacterized protein YndB with AHSA1/START domain
MSNPTHTSAQDAIVEEIQIAAPPERVFQAITRPEELRRWFSNITCPARVWEMDARPGGCWRFATDISKNPLNGVTQFRATGEITEIDPPRLLVYTWHANWHDDPSLATVVRWELSAKDGGTFVRVTHSNLGNEPVARADYISGWPGVMKMLKEFAENPQH